MRGAAAPLRHEFIGLYGMVERNWYLIKRYAWWEIAFFFWTAANTLTIVFIAKGVVATGGKVNIDRLTTILLIGAVIWSYLGIVFELLIETIAWERWEGTIEYTFMAPLTRAVHLLGTGIFAIGYGIVRASIVFIAKGVDATGGHIDLNRTQTTLLIGGVIWSYLGIVFEILTETVAWERWEGTIEYTFMAPLSRPVHLLGMGVFAIGYGVVRAVLLFGVVAAFIGIHVPDANYAAAVALLSIASVSFIGLGMMTAVLPLISPEKGTQLGFVAQGVLLVVSGVYYPVSVLPGWMQLLAKISPATYALRGCREAILEGAGVTALWSEIWPLLVIGAVAVPLGLWIFRIGERYAKKHGKLKRSG